MSNINDLIIFELNNAEQVLAKTDKFTPQSVQTVLNNGGYRDIKQHTNGLNTGSKILQNKYGIKEKFINPFSSRGAYTDPDLSTIHIPFPLWNMSRVNKYTEENPNASLWSRFKSGFDPSGVTTALERRHETDEARIGQNILDRNGLDPNTPNVAGISFMTPKDPETKELAPNLDSIAPELVTRTGGHVSPQVLQNEKPLVQYASNFTNALNADMQYRNSSGEYGPSIQELTPKQIRKIEDASVQHNLKSAYKAQNISDEYDRNYSRIVDNFKHDNPTFLSKVMNLRKYFNKIKNNDIYRKLALSDNYTDNGAKYVMTPYEFNPLTPIYTDWYTFKDPDYNAHPLHGLIQNPNAIESEAYKKALEEFAKEFQINSKSKHI